MDERELRIAQARRARMIRRAVWMGLAVIVIGGALWAAVSYGRKSSASRPGVFVENQGQPHVALNTPFAYNSNPPTSGPHHAAPAEWGVYQKEIHDQILIHNLEHGGIWIAYKPDLDPAVVGRLEAVARDFGRKVIMAPRSANDSDIALAAWTRLDKFSAAEFSEERIRAFIKAYRNKGPEFVP